MLIEKKTFFTDCLHIYILFSFGFAQPLFELLSTQAEFFAIRRSEPIRHFPPHPLLGHFPSHRFLL